MEAIEFDITDQLDTFNKASKDMPFIISKSLNDIAFKNMRNEFSKDMKDNLLMRNKAFANKGAFKVEKASKTDLSITVAHKREDLGLQQYSGTEKAKTKKLAIPVRKTFQKYAGVNNTKSIPKSLKIGTLFDKAPKDGSSTKVYKTKGIKPFIRKGGVYIRVSDGSDGLRKLYTFVDKAVHTKKKIDFQKVTNETMNKKFERQLDVHYKKLLFR